MATTEKRDDQAARIGTEVARWRERHYFRPIGMSGDKH
jgi:hypothetical protein